MIKAFKFLLKIFVCTLSIYILTAILVALLLDIMTFIRNIFPLQGFTGVVLLYIVGLLSILLVILGSGMFYCTTLRIVRISIIVFVLSEFLYILLQNIYTANILGLSSIKVFCIALLGDSIVLVAGLLLSNPLYLIGRKVCKKNNGE
jgi:hypothetical protein